MSYQTGHNHWRVDPLYHRAESIDCSDDNETQKCTDKRPCRDEYVANLWSTSISVPEEPGQWLWEAGDAVAGYDAVEVIVNIEVDVSCFREPHSVSRFRGC